MSKAGQQVRSKAVALAAMVLVAAVKALAEESYAGQNDAALQQSQAPPRRIVVSIPDRKAALLEADSVVKIYPVAVGAPGSPSPTGQFKIANRIIDPTYYAPGLVVPPGKANPLGTRWIGLSQKGYGIHGTNNPRSIGRRASHGCIRMRNRDVEDLFRLVSVGDVVELHGERNAQLIQIFGLAERTEKPVLRAASNQGSVAGQ